MGLMPAYRGGETPLWGLKTVVIAPGNAARNMDLHQGFVALFDGETGETRALLNAGGITAVRTAAVSAVATRSARARRRAHARDPRRRHPGQGEPRGDARGARLRSGRCLEQDARPRSRRARRRRGSRHRRGGGPRCRRRRHCDVRSRADRPAQLAEGGRARERRRLEHPDDARARHRDDARRCPVRRPARVDRQRGR